MCTAVGPQRPISPNKTTLITVLCMYHVVFGQLLKVKWRMRSAECGVWKMRSVENAECGKCGVWKV